MRRFGFGKSRLEACLQLSGKLNAILHAVSTNDISRAITVAGELKPWLRAIHLSDFTILRNHFLLSYHVNCVDRLQFARELDQARLIEHRSDPTELLFGWHYHENRMPEVFKLATLPIPPVPQPLEPDLSAPQAGKSGSP
eukprot:RCo029080